MTSSTGSYTLPWLLPLVLVLVAVERASCSSRPIVGVLAQEVPAEVRRLEPVSNLLLADSRSYIPASYVKAVEAAGARVVPIFINQTEEYYRTLMSMLNGVVLPGGSTDFRDAGGYGAAGGMIVDIAYELQDSGVNFPILGVCQGCELLFYLSANRSLDILVGCNSTNTALPLDFRPGFESSQLFGQASQEIIEILKTLPVTSNHHRFCVTEEKIREYRLQKTWRVLSTNHDQDGLEFVSSSEHFHRPIVAVQFHPEKNVFEWSPSQANPHFRKAVLSARHFYDWLVTESRLNNQSFPSWEQEDSHVIYNYNPVYTGEAGGYNEQLYLFSAELPHIRKKIKLP